MKDKQSSGNLYTHLRCKKKRKKRYGSARSARGKMIPNRVDVDKRSTIVESRRRIGDWEGDTIIGTHIKGAVIASMVERKS